MSWKATVFLFFKYPFVLPSALIFVWATKVVDTFKSSEFRLQAVTARTYDRNRLKAELRTVNR